MGVSISANKSTKKQHNGHQVEFSKLWTKAGRTKKSTKSKLMKKHEGWNVVRIFVSSTFKDFHAEREILVKKVFSDLRAWCESRKLYLVECDLRWGVPKDSDTEATLRACLSEIDRCFHDNGFPFFVNMTGDRVGWVPVGEEVPETIREEYDWVDGLSVTEMEIVHGAYRVNNPNALFMLRDSSFIKNIPEDYKAPFIEGTEKCQAKLEALRTVIKTKYKPDQVVTYKVKVTGCDPDTKMVQLGGLDEVFSKTVLEFFKTRIEQTYPQEENDIDPYVRRKQEHEAFMKNRSQNLIGRTSMLKQINRYGSCPCDNVPLLILGEAGCGKSSLMAKATDQLLHTTSQNTKLCVFYHFVGAVPGSTELLPMLQRLLKELDVVTEDSMPRDVDTASQLTCSTLANPNTKPCLITVDAVNQLDEESASQLMSWIPEKLAPRVGCILSMISGTAQHKSFTSRKITPEELHVTALTDEDKKMLVTEKLGVYNKRLDKEQMTSLLSKSSSHNPLWLSIACEELRMFGLFRKITEKISNLPDELLELEMLVLSRLETENGGELLVATLCLLEVSARGLLETELLTILAQQHNPSSSEANHTHGSKQSCDILPYYKWTEVYRGLRIFLRPFGNSGEGRLDFYHRSFSKAVRHKYLSGDDQEEKYRSWHAKLANYFEFSCHNRSRTLEELPIHLIANKECSRLENYLTDWKVFELLYNEDYSVKLLEYWRMGSSVENMDKAYKKALVMYSKSPTTDLQDLSDKYIKVARLLVQGGRHASASNLCASSMQIETTKLGKRPDKMAELYFLKAYILDDMLELEDYMYHGQLSSVSQIIENYLQAVHFYDTLSGDVIMRKRGKIYKRLSFYYSGYALRGGDESLTAEQARVKSREMVDIAIDIFTKLKDDIFLADCIMTKGVSYGTACPEQLQCYKKAEAVAHTICGELHNFLDCLYLNTGIYYEESGDFNAAFDYFHKWYIMCCNLYGKSHPKAQRPVATLQEEKYVKIAQERNIVMPEFIL